MTTSGLQVAINQVIASGGGEVKVPSGTIHWNSETVTISKGNVNITGSGVDNTIFQNDASAPFNEMILVDASDNAPVRISGIWFKGQFASTNDDVSGSALKISRSVNFRVDHNKFTDFPSKAISAGNYYYSYVQPKGVVDHNTFYNPYKLTYGGIWGYGIISVGPINLETAWDSEVSNIDNFLGKYETISSHIPVVYAEDNSFTLCRHAIDAAGSGWFVARHNTFHTPFGYEICCHAGSRGMEVYENTIDCSGTSYEHDGVGFRGGGGVCWGNTIANANSGVEITWEVGSYDQKEPHNIWIWGNTYVNNGREFGLINNAYSNVIENTDYFLYQKAGYVPYPYPFPLVSGNPYVPPSPTPTPTPTATPSPNSSPSVSPSPTPYGQTPSPSEAPSPTPLPTETGNIIIDIINSIINAWNSFWHWVLGGVT